MAINIAFTLAASHGSHQHRHHEMQMKGKPVTYGKWRRGWDSNPRYGFPYARFRGEYFQPLSHLSAVVADLIVAERSVFRQSRRGHYANALGSTELSLCNAAGQQGHRENRESTG